MVPGSTEIRSETTSGDAVDEAQIKVLAPVTPSKIVAVGLNYRDHAKEMNKALPDEPLIFIKPSTAVIGLDDDIVMPPSSSPGRLRSRAWYRHAQARARGAG